MDDQTGDLEQERSQTMPLGIVVERRALKNPWQDFEWRPVAVIPGAAANADWQLLDEGEDWVRFLIATKPLELHRKETEGYKVNLANHQPVIYVALSPVEELECEHEVEAFLVTASPFEAQDYLDTGDTIIEGVPMPRGVLGWVKDFVDRHHVEEPFLKRKRKRYGTGDDSFSRPAPVSIKRKGPKFD